MRIVFHHIPKAGGTSVVKALSQATRHHRIAFQRQLWGEDAMGARGCYSSHYSFADHQPADGDFYFTWVRNPADMFYSAWRYYKCRVRPNKHYQPEATARFLREFAGAASLEEYTDRCLEADHPHTFPRGLFDLPWERFHFVGVTERMDESIAELSRLTGLPLTPLHVNATGSDNSYRRDEVEALLSRELEIYQRWS